MLMNLRNAMMTGKKIPYLQLSEGVVFIASMQGVGRIVVDFTNDNDVETTSSKYLCGFGFSSYQYYDYRGGSGSSENWINYVGRVLTTDGKPHRLEWEDSQPGTIDGVIVRPNWKVAFGNNNLCVGYVRYAGVSWGNTWTGKIFRVELYDSSDALISRFVPDKSGTLKNEATGTLCTKVGTATYGEGNFVLPMATAS
ncbi:MAG: hypothetical protein J6V72_12090 [Kiritimatiellae bacterium]|nr:hypothetical protein [Kiritimatiellia bacterium]